MQSVLKNIPDDRVKAYFIWLPVIRSDDRDSAVKRSKEFQNARVAHYWDDDSLTGKRWDPILKTGPVAWDVYLIYSASAAWEKEPPVPSFWMHQLRGIEHAPRLDKTIFETKVRELLNSAVQSQE